MVWKESPLIRCRKSVLRVLRTSANPLSHSSRRRCPVSMRKGWPAALRSTSFLLGMLGLLCAPWNVLEKGAHLPLATMTTFRCRRRRLGPVSVMTVRCRSRSLISAHSQRLSVAVWGWSFLLRASGVCRVSGSFMWSRTMCAARRTTRTGAYGA